MNISLPEALSLFQDCINNLQKEINGTRWFETDDIRTQIVLENYKAMIKSFQEQANVILCSEIECNHLSYRDAVTFGLDKYYSPELAAY